MGGTVIGRDDIVLTGVASLERAGPRHLTFLASRRYLPYLARARAGAVLVTPEFRDVAAGPATRIVVRDPTRALNQVTATLCAPAAPRWGLHPTARIGAGSRWRERLALHAGAVLGRNVRLGANCVVGVGAVLEDDVTVGDDCRIGPHALVHAGTRLGHRVVLKAGARVGGDGFGFVPGERGPERLVHSGGCVLDDDVEVGANTTVDRGRLDDTVIGRGTKLDNLVQVGHNVRLGARCLVMAQVGIGGSTVVEDEVVLAGQAGLADHVTVERGARVAAQSGVIGTVSPGATVSGYPARSHRTVLRQTAALQRLTPLVDALERLVEAHERA